MTKICDFISTFNRKSVKTDLILHLTIAAKPLGHIRNTFGLNSSFSSLKSFKLDRNINQDPLNVLANDDVTNTKLSD